VSRSDDELRDALFAVEALPYGLARSAAAEQLVAEVEAAGARGVMPAAYHCLVQSYVFGAETQKAFVPFSRQLRLYDAEPALFSPFDTFNLLWSFKWMTTGLWKFPGVPREQIERTIDDMERRYALAGVGMNAVRYVHFTYAWQRGDWAEADRGFDAWVSSPRDRYSQCRACEPSDLGGYLAERGRDPEALEHLDGVTLGGLSCAEEPHHALATSLLPLVRLGRLDDARHAHVRGLQLIRGQLEFQDKLGRHLEFLARTGNEARGLELLSEHATLLVEQKSPHARMELLAAVGLTVRRVGEVAGAGVPVAGPSGQTTAGELAAWARREALALAGAFDARNGTGWHGERTLGTLDAEPLVTSLRLGLGRPLRAQVETPQVTAEPDQADLAERLDLAALLDRADELTDLRHPAAAGLWHRAEALAGDDRSRARIEEGLGRALMAADPAAARSRLDRAVALRAGLDDHVALAVARSLAALAAAHCGDGEGALARVRAAGAVLDAGGTPEQRWRQRYRDALATSLTATGERGRAEAAERFRQTAALAAQLGDPEPALLATAHLYDLEPPPDPAGVVDFLQSYVDTMQRLERPWRLGDLYGRLGLAQRAAGRQEAALHALEESVRHGDAWGDKRSAARSAHQRAEVLAQLERHDEARERAFDALVRAEDAGLEGLAVAARTLLGLAYHQLDRHHEAVGFLREGLAGRDPDDPDTGLVHYRLGVSLLRVREQRDGAAHLARASEIAERGGDPGSAGHAARLAGDALAVSEPDTAAAAYERAARLFAAAGADVELLRAHRSRARVLHAGGRAAEALSELELAGAAAERLTPEQGVDPRWERAEIDYHAADLLTAAERGREALERATAAERGHVEVGAQHDAAYDAALASRILLSLLDDPVEAEATARRAAALAEAAEDEAAYEHATIELHNALDALRLRAQ
jgi:tetratricopeptide (TPR) repeat protein